MDEDAGTARADAVAVIVNVTMGASVEGMCGRTGVVTPVCTAPVLTLASAPDDAVASGGTRMGLGEEPATRKARVRGGTSVSTLASLATADTRRECSAIQPAYESRKDTNSPRVHTGCCSVTVTLPPVFGATTVASDANPSSASLTLRI